MSGRIPLPMPGVPTRDPQHVDNTLADDGTTLIDGYGRLHNNLRISVTDRCNLRCTYCMPEDVVFQDKHELLSFEEIARVVRVAATLGVNKIRLTGGEPLLRRDLHELVAMLQAIPGIEDIGLTTNGLLLAQQAEALHAAGLRRLNVSLDTLDPVHFRELSRRDGLELVLTGLEKARSLGFAPIKVNAVAIRGYAEQDIVPLARYCREQGFEIRFIEYMPIGAEAWDRKRVFPAREILDLIDREVAPLELAAGHDPHAPALEYAYRDGRGQVGIIASVTQPFCNQCNRIRLTADGSLRYCLFALEETAVKGLLRGTGTDADIARAIRQTVARKWPGHGFNSENYVKPERTMHAIGG